MHVVWSSDDCLPERKKVERALMRAVDELANGGAARLFKPDELQYIMDRVRSAR